MMPVPPSIPSLLFDNRTDFDALHFDTIDQNGVGFHVIVAKTAYALGPCDAKGVATLVPLDEPAPLNLEDRHHDDDLAHSVRVESDLAPFKPLCDVIVVGAAHAPGGKPARRFEAGLRVQAPDTSLPLPAKPLPLNPMQPLSLRALQEWEEQVAKARRGKVPGDVLVDKTLHFTGERQLRRRLAPLRFLQGLIAIGTLGLVRPNPYRLTRPRATASVPLRYEHAQGGQCRIEPGERAARRVARRHRLTAAQQAAYPPDAPAPVAHDSSQVNPDGCGFARPWYLRAARVKTLPAPQIDYPAAPFSARRFWRNARGKLALVPAGFGFVGRGWLPRRTLIGRIEVKTAWAADEVPQLPKEFDFRYWNGAPEDQQCRHLEGGERFMLTNLCAPARVFAAADGRGNTRLSFTLPEQLLFLLGADANHSVATLPLAVDTVVIDVDAGTVELVWRYCLVADASFANVRLLHAVTAEQLARVRDWSAPSSETAQAVSAPSTAAII